MPDSIVSESNLEFVLDSERLFLPEQEEFYKKLSSRVSVKSCDFVYLTADNTLLLIEVKSSSPKENQAFVQEIRQKFVDSVLIYIAAWAGRENTQPDSMSPILRSTDALKRRMRLVLIVKDHKPAWLPPLRDSLREACRPFEQLFSLEETQVYNQDLARRKLGLTING